MMLLSSNLFLYFRLRGWYFLLLTDCWLKCSAFVKYLLSVANGMAKLHLDLGYTNSDQVLGCADSGLCIASTWPLGEYKPTLSLGYMNTHLACSLLVKHLVKSVPRYDVMRPFGKIQLKPEEINLSRTHHRYPGLDEDKLEMGFDEAVVSEKWKHTFVFKVIWGKKTFTML